MLGAVTVLIVVVGLVQLPLLTDLLIHLFPSSPLPRLASRATKPIFVLLFLACCGLALYLFFFVFLPVTLHSHAAHLSSPSAYCLAGLLSCLAVYIVSSMLYHYISAAFLPASLLSTSSSPSVDPSSPVRSCVKCGVVKGYRTHHCRICNRCTALMDHHCPFTANCVGRDNLRSFILWLSFCCLGLLYGAVMSYPAFAHCILHRSALPPVNELNFTFTTALVPATAALPSTVWSVAYCKSLSNTPWTFVLVAFGQVSVVSLWAMQLWLMTVDMTTLELLVGVGKKAGMGEMVEGGDRMMREREMEQETLHERLADESGVAGGAERMETGGSTVSNARSTRLRKGWHLVHRNEPLYRLLLPDPLWSLLDRRQAKGKP